jgi:hypothetical protein
MVEDWNHDQSSLYFKPKTEKDGSTYQILRVEGLFVQPFSLADYPLDRQQLSIKVEDQIHGADKLAYEFDMKNSGVGDLVQIPGWNLEGWKAESLTHDYETNFGEHAMARVYSMAKFSIEISRPENFFLWKLLLPLFMVIIAACSEMPCFFFASTWAWIFLKNSGFLPINSISWSICSSFIPAAFSFPPIIFFRINF